LTLISVTGNKTDHLFSPLESASYDCGCPHFMCLFQFEVRKESC